MTVLKLHNFLAVTAVLFFTIHGEGKDTSVPKLNITLKVDETSEIINNYIALNGTVFLTCIVHNNASNLTGHINLKLQAKSKDTQTEYSWTQHLESCTMEKGEGWCGSGTSLWWHSVKEYMATFYAKEEDFAPWRCSVTTPYTTIKSNVLDLAQYHICQLTCVKGNITKPCRCVCDPNWAGVSCEICTLKCIHGTMWGECQCRCKNGWTGPTCEECDLSCTNGDIPKNNCSCQCYPGWSGDSCEVCGKTCEHGEVDYKKCNCRCKHLWSGPNCEDCHTKCDHGTFSRGECKCVCEEGWMGPICSLDDIGNPELMTGSKGIALLSVLAILCVMVIIGVPVGWVLYKRMGKPKETDEDETTEDNSYFATAFVASENKPITSKKHRKHTVTD